MDAERARRGLAEFIRALELPAGEVDAERASEAMVRAFREDFLRGYSCEPADYLSVEFEGAGDDLVLVRDIPFVSMCSHHLLPFFGLAHVAYLPQGKLTGLSSIARLVDGFACRLQNQERLARSVATALIERLGARGAACRVEATQLCVVGRSTRKPGIRSVSECLLGVFESDVHERRRFLELVGATGSPGP
jgi:GTP cyclohydrolase I